MDPLRRGPFLTFDDRAAPMEAEQIDVKAEEEHRVFFLTGLTAAKQINQPC
jgi:hypothetical protein